MTENSTTTVEKIVAIGGGFSEYKQPNVCGETTTNMVIATLREPVAITYNGTDPTDPKPATVWGIQYWIKREGTVQVSLLTTRTGHNIAPDAVLGLSWAVAR